MLQRRLIRHLGGRLALLGLGLQLVLSFGHMHPEEVFGPLGLLVQQGQGIVQLSADRYGNALTPIQQHESGAAEELCSVCAAMALIASALPPDPVLLQRAASSSAEHAVGSLAFLLDSVPFLLFQTRAPPSSEII
jgi:hypothetical protein